MVCSMSVHGQRCTVSPFNDVIDSTHAGIYSHVDIQCIYIQHIQVQVQVECVCACIYMSCAKISQIIIGYSGNVHT